jgi:hypothetical protein
MRRFVLLVVLALLAVAPSAQAKLFAPWSVWNKRVSDHPALDPNSAAISQTLLQMTRTHTTWIDTDAYSTPIYTVGADQPRVPVRLTSWRSETPMATLLGNGIPIPPTALPAIGSDAHMTVWQPSRDRIWDLWGAAKTDGKWTAQTADAFNHVSSSPGFSSKDSWAPFTDHTWTSTATSLPVSAGTMTVPQIRRGRIGHALALDIPGARAGEYSWPAQQTDGYDNSAASIPEGAHFVLRRNYNCNKMQLQIAHTICWAAKYRGLIVRDQAPGVGLYAEDPVVRYGRGAKDPYYGANKLFGGQYPNNFLSPERFPWSQMKLLKMDLCTNPSQPCTR